MFAVQRGTNVSHWLSQVEGRTVEGHNVERSIWFAEEDVQRIAGWGCDHIRLPVDEVQLWDDSGNREPEAFELLNHALDWCE
ncbi:MAG: glycoside hydrolase family 5 protein, partial [Chloroflexi bacterium]|nr:glycoside hydrolase family 5 protein [Chloroflexota bacterium]